MPLLYPIAAAVLGFLGGFFSAGGLTSLSRLALLAVAAFLFWRYV